MFVISSNLILLDLENSSTVKHVSLFMDFLPCSTVTVKYAQLFMGFLP
jgi:hypothetical protein